MRPSYRRVRHLHGWSGAVQPLLVVVRGQIWTEIQSENFVFLFFKNKHDSSFINAVTVSTLRGATKHVSVYLKVTGELKVLV